MYACACGTSGLRYKLICLSGAVLLRQGLREKVEGYRALLGSSIPGYIGDHNPGIRLNPFNLALYHPTGSIERGKQDDNPADLQDFPKRI